MSSYTHFTEEEKEEASNTDLVSFLRHREKHSGSEYEWKSDSGKVTIRGSLCFISTKERGGDAIRFVQRYGNLTFPEAVSYLLSERGIVINRPHEESGQKEKSRFPVKKKSPPYKDWNESLKAGHGIPPIPAEEHSGMVRMKAMCRELVEDYAEEKCSRYPLEELQERYDKLKQRAKSKKINPEQSYEMAWVAFLFAKKQLAAMEKGYTTEQYVSALFSLYPPHHDNCGYTSRLSQMGERLQELKQVMAQNEILPESGQEKIVQNTMSLAVDCLRLSMYAENQCQCQSQNQNQSSCERRESLCPVLQQS